MSSRHARACPGHPRLLSRISKTWMAGTSPAHDGRGLQALVPGRNRIERRVDQFIVEDLHHLAVLNLDHDLRQRDLTVFTKADASVHALEIRLGNAVAKLSTAATAAAA